MFGREKQNKTPVAESSPVEAESNQIEVGSSSERAVLMENMTLSFGIESDSMSKEEYAEKIGEKALSSVEFKTETGEDGVEQIVGSRISNKGREIAGLMHSENRNNPEWQDPDSRREMMNDWFTPMIEKGFVSEEQRDAVITSFNRSFGAQERYLNNLEEIASGTDEAWATVATDGKLKEQLSDPVFREQVAKDMHNMVENPRALTSKEKEQKETVKEKLASKSQSIRDKWGSKWNRWQEKRAESQARKVAEKETQTVEEENDDEPKWRFKDLVPLKHRVAYVALTASVVAATLFCSGAVIAESASTVFASEGGQGIELLSDKDDEGPNAESLLAELEGLGETGELNSETLVNEMQELSPQEAQEAWASYLATNPDMSFSYLTADGELFTAGDFNELSASELSDSGSELPALEDDTSVANYFMLDDTTVDATDNSIMFYNHNNLENEASGDGFSFAPDQEEGSVVITGSEGNYFVWVEVGSDTQETLGGNAQEFAEQFGINGEDGDDTRPNAVGQTCPTGNFAQQAMSELGLRNNADDARHGEQYKLMGQLTPDLMAELGIDGGGTAIAQADLN